MAGCVRWCRKGMKISPVLFPSTSRQRCKSESISSYYAHFCGVFHSRPKLFLHSSYPFPFLYSKKKKYEFPVHLEKQSKPFAKEITSLATVQHKNCIRRMRKLGKRYTDRPTWRTCLAGSIQVSSVREIWQKPLIFGWGFFTLSIFMWLLDYMFEYFLSRAIRKFYNCKL